MEKLSKSAKYAYMFGDLGCCLLSFMLNYFMFYCTNMLGISLMTVGTIIFVAKIWDAVNDIGVGLLVDRTHTKDGKARPWLKWFAIPCALSCVMMFTAPVNGSNTVKIVWVAIGYFLFALFYTTVNLPYGSLMPLMTKDQNERASLSSIRMFGAYGGIFLVNATALPMVAFLGKKMGGRVYGYGATAVVLGVVAVICFFTVYHFCKELKVNDEEEIKQEVVKEKKAKEEVSIGKSLKCLVQNRPWLIVFVITVLNFLKSTFTNTTMTYYFLYYFQQDETKSALFSSASVIVSLIVIPLVPAIVKKTGYKKSMMASIFFAAVSYIAAFMAGRNMMVVFVFFTIGQALSTVPSVAVVSMLADTLEYGELKHGVRLDGLGFAANSFSSKIGPAVAGYFATILYSVGRLDTTLGLGDAQPDSAILILKMCMFVIPALLGLVQAVLLIGYPLTAEKMEEINSELKKRHNEQALEA